MNIALAVVAVVTFAYSIVVAGQILLWFVLAGIAAGIYVAWLLVVAVLRLVDATERIASALEAEHGDSTGDNSGDNNDGSNDGSNDDDHQIRGVEVDER
ncbi:hypothetical protein [Halobellus inordinatus]|uniref:hypothetical protein n=1 Tax=Halobellus inordinatus TaxID=1126236 RepID=UPI002113EBF8|nr:hypothetical protein [Halobellus ramosii]